MKHIRTLEQVFPIGKGRVKNDSTHMCERLLEVFYYNFICYIYKDIVYINNLLIKEEEKSLLIITFKDLLTADEQFKIRVRFGHVNAAAKIMFEYLIQQKSPIVQEASPADLLCYIVGS